MNKKYILFSIVVLIIITGGFLYFLYRQQPQQRNRKNITIKYCEGDPWSGDEQCANISAQTQLPIDTEIKAVNLLKEVKNRDVKIEKENLLYWYYEDYQGDGTYFAGCSGELEKKTGNITDTNCMHSSP